MEGTFYKNWMLVLTFILSVPHLQKKATVQKSRIPVPRRPAATKKPADATRETRKPQANQAPPAPQETPFLSEMSDLDPAVHDYDEPGEASPAEDIPYGNLAPTPTFADVLDRTNKKRIAAKKKGLLTPTTALSSPSPVKAKFRKVRATAVSKDVASPSKTKTAASTIKKSSTNARPTKTDRSTNGGIALKTTKVKSKIAPPARLPKKGGYSQQRTQESETARGQSLPSAETPQEEYEHNAELEAQAPSDGKFQAQQGYNADFDYSPPHYAQSHHQQIQRQDSLPQPMQQNYLQQPEGPPRATHLPPMDAPWQQPSPQQAWPGYPDGNPTQGQTLPPRMGPIRRDRLCAAAPFSAPTPGSGRNQCPGGVQEEGAECRRHTSQQYGAEAAHAQGRHCAVFNFPADEAPRGIFGPIDSPWFGGWPFSFW
jgi:hypothetical protein